MPLALDASPVLAAIFAEEAREFGSGVIDRVRAEGGVVPALFALEVRNVLISGERRRRITPELVDAALADLDALGLIVDDGLDPNACVRLARRHGLTVYDASYLELAARRRLTLASLDTALVRAATADGVDVLTAPSA